LYHTLNHASRHKDITKIKTIGPFGMALSKIIATAQSLRSDINPKKFVGSNLFRGAGMTENELKEFKLALGKEI